jgi:hypothetical protein
VVEVELQLGMAAGLRRIHPGDHQVRDRARLPALYRVDRHLGGQPGDPQVVDHDDVPVAEQFGDAADPLVGQQGAATGFVSRAVVGGGHREPVQLRAHGRRRRPLRPPVVDGAQDAVSQQIGADRHGPARRCRDRHRCVEQIGFGPLGERFGEPVHRGAGAVLVAAELRMVEAVDVVEGDDAGHATVFVVRWCSAPTIVS